MPDALDDERLSEIRTVVGAVNANTLRLPGHYGTTLEFGPGTLLCWDVTWICGEPIHGSCWYDPDGWGYAIFVLAGGVLPLRIRGVERPCAHFPDYVVWRVDTAPRNRDAQNRMPESPDATLPTCPDSAQSSIPARANDETQ